MGLVSGKEKMARWEEYSHTEILLFLTGSKIKQVIAWKVWRVVLALRSIQ